MKDTISLWKFRNEIMFYLVTRVALIFFIIKYMGSMSFLDDIKFMYLFGSNPICLMTGSFMESASILCGAYAPLEPFIYAPFVFITSDINGIRLAAFIFEFAVLIMMIIIGNNVITENILHKTVLIYIILPLSWVEDIIWAQDEILAALFLMIIIFLETIERQKLAAFFLGITCVFSKIVPFVVFVPLCLLSRDKIRTIILAIAPILAVYVPVNFWYNRIGIDNPTICQILAGNSNKGITIPYLLRTLSVPDILKDSLNLQINWGVFAFVLLLISYVIYYVYLIYRYKKRDLPNIYDMILVSFFIYLVFSFAQIHPEQYIFILPIILLRLAILDRINLTEFFYLLTFSLSSILWKGIVMLRFLSANPSYIQESMLPHKILELHNNIIGNQFLKFEEFIVLSITLIVIVRYFIIFINKVMMHDLPSSIK